MIGEIQHKLHERVNEAMPGESYPELRAKVHMAEEDGTSGILSKLVDGAARIGGRARRRGGQARRVSPMARR